MPPVQIAVLASGRGSNLQALLDALDTGDAPGSVALVISNREDAGALDLARGRNIAAATIGRDGTDAPALISLLRTHDIGLVVLAGYLKRVPDAVVIAWRGRVLNIHPALLPAFGGAGMYGRRVHEAVLASGVRLTGATVHVVDEQYDHGPIVAQWPVPVRHGDTPEALAARVLALEHQLLPAAVKAACRHIARYAEPPRPLAAANEAFVLASSIQTDFDHALIPA
ncbi:MAG TPA: phosphoribosylglycinamide formyltransferase [Gemmatimonadales bacterium]